MLDYEQIKRALAAAKEEGRQTALFHYITFHYAEDIINENPEYFCRKVGMKESFATEVKKMIKLHGMVKSGRGEQYLKQAE